MEPLKNLISPDLIRSYADEAKRQFDRFDDKGFLAAILNNEWEGRELRDRINHVTRVFYEVLDRDFDSAVGGLEKMAANLPSGFEYLVFPTYVEFYGLENFDRSMLALERLTEFSTGEFAIRPFLKKWPDKTMEQMFVWSKHSNDHVRRLSSEGCRPRLPWGGNLKDFIEEPQPIFDLLENLKRDDSLYVRKSVANNLNDISKDHPNRVLDLANRWKNINHKHSNWIVKRALRTLLKDAHPVALEIFDYAPSTSYSLSAFQLKEKRLAIGDRLNFSVCIENKGSQKAKTRLEYLVDYKKKNGSSAKVFHWLDGELEAGEKRDLTKYQPFHDMTTRKHYPGEHRIGIRVNGVEMEWLSFELTE